MQKTSGSEATDYAKVVRSGRSEEDDLEEDGVMDRAHGKNLL